MNRLSCLLLAMLLGCATGEQVGGGSDPSGGSNSSGGRDGQGGAAGGPTTVGPTTSSTGAGAGDEGGAGGLGGAGGAGGAGEGGLGGAGQGGDPGPVCDFSAPEVCEDAELLPDTAGDEDGAVVTRSGIGSKWFKVHILENSGNVFERDLSYRVTLSSPAAADYDLVIYQGEQEGDPNCAAGPQVASGEPAVIQNGWDDETPIGGEDDSLWVIIEVRHVGGEGCAPGDTWSLEVRGHV